MEMGKVLKELLAFIIMLPTHSKFFQVMAFLLTPHVNATHVVRCKWNNHDTWSADRSTIGYSTGASVLHTSRHRRNMRGKFNSCRRNFCQILPREIDKLITKLLALQC